MLKVVMPKIKILTNEIQSHPILRKGSFVLLTLLMVGGFVLPPMVQADQFEEQIKELNQQNANNQAQAVQLAAQAETYQQAVDQLQNQINTIQAQITANQAKSDDLQRQIVEAEAELVKQKKVLGESIRTIYLEGQISTLEMLASSKDLSDFVDKQQYRDSVQSKIKNTLDKINALKAQLKNQKQEVEKLLAEQRQMQAQVAADRDKQSQMLAYTQSQKADYERQIKETNSKISSIRAQQAAFYAQLTGGGTRNYGSSGNFQFRNLSGQQYCGGGYNYCWAYHDQWVSDTWGLSLARECVHYAADRAARGLNLAPYLGGGQGSAYQWPSSLDGAYRVDHSPAVGAVAVVMDGDIPPVGHVMYVEYVLGDGWVGVSQMNWDGRGSYSTMEVNSSGLWFIHF